jgi:hypothetical protein
VRSPKPEKTVLRTLISIENMFAGYHAEAAQTRVYDNFDKCIRLAHIYSTPDMRAKRYVIALNSLIGFLLFPLNAALGMLTASCIS